MTSKSFVTRLTFVASSRPEALEAREKLAARYGDHGVDDAQVIVDKVGTFLNLFHAADITTSQGPDADVKAFFDSLQIKQDEKRAIMSATMPLGFLSKIFRDAPELSGTSAPPSAPAAAKKPSAHKKPSH